MRAFFRALSSLVVLLPLSLLPYPALSQDRQFVITEGADYFGADYERARRRSRRLPGGLQRGRAVPSLHLQRGGALVLPEERRRRAARRRWRDLRPRRRGGGSGAGRPRSETHQRARLPRAVLYRHGAPPDRRDRRCAGPARAASSRRRLPPRRWPPPATISAPWTYYRGALHFAPERLRPLDRLHRRRDPRLQRRLGSAAAAQRVPHLRRRSTPTSAPSPTKSAPMRWS